MSVRRLAAIAWVAAIVATGALDANVVAGETAAHAGARAHDLMTRLKPAACASGRAVAGRGAVPGRRDATRRHRTAKRHRGAGDAAWSDVVERKVRLRAGSARAARRRGAGPARRAPRGCERPRGARPPAQSPAPRPAAAPALPGAAPIPQATAPGAPTADPAAPASPAPPAPATQAGPPSPVVSTLGVSAYDIGGFVLRLTRSAVPAGDLTVFFRNHDVSDHNLWIEGPGGDRPERISDTVGEDGGASRTLAVTAGAWRLFCALPDHGAMTRTLTVTP